MDQKRNTVILQLSNRIVDTSTSFIPGGRGKPKRQKIEKQRQGKPTEKLFSLKVTAQLPELNVIYENEHKRRKQLKIDAKTNRSSTEECRLGTASNVNYRSGMQDFIDVAK